MKRHIPNFVTLLNVFCGSVAVIFAVNGNMKLTALFVFLGVFFDFFDGLLARKLKVQSNLGLQLDSLADMITSGLVPGLVMFHLFNLAGPDWIELSANQSITGLSMSSNSFLPFFGLFITLASAYRLANFNIDENQTDAFIGLPTPANALLILSLPLIMEYQSSDIMNAIILNKWFLIAVTLISCYLLNANIKLLALKFKNWSFKDNASRYILIILAAILIIILHFAAIPLIILVYIIISLLNK
ncbi:CDP-diacylglycerol--serine O-phosphatidyltransferase [hydrothermal vent metagenome]|uniref:CDP-diacylglycerol--serine O-phosphatidyltransferase n=1 Tax=hydrothermal vent metagenome TaxID=652676 RepID=A0A3B0RMK6_9ZZZZ